MKLATRERSQAKASAMRSRIDRRVRLSKSAVAAAAASFGGVKLPKRSLNAWRGETVAGIGIGVPLEFTRQESMSRRIGDDWARYQEAWARKMSDLKVV